MTDSPLITERDKVRFWAKVRVLGEDECWLWTGYTTGKGYGQFSLNGRHWYAHRLAYLLANGFIPEGLQINHGDCNNRKCVNPRHLYPGTQQDNMRDMVNAERQSRGEARYNAVFTEAQIAQIRDLYAEGNITQDELGERYGVTRNTISQIITGRHWTHAGGAKPAWQGKRDTGEKHGRSVLTENDVREIRRLYAQGGVTYEALGKRYGVHYTTILYAVTRKTWKHID